MKMKTTQKTKTGVFYIPIDRRRFFKSMALASAGFTLPGYLAEALMTSPIVTQGPYYPLASNIPLDKDNDLVQLNDNLTLASGIVSYVSGHVFDSSGNPVTMANLAWGALPFSLTQTSTIDRNIYTAPSDGTLNLYVEAKSAKGFYFVSFRVPGANTGTL
jgi:hypothetical protein